MEGSCRAMRGRAAFHLWGQPGQVTDKSMGVHSPRRQRRVRRILFFDRKPPSAKPILHGATVPAVPTEGKNRAYHQSYLRPEDFFFRVFDYYCKPKRKEELMKNLKRAAFTLIFTLLFVITSGNGTVYAKKLPAIDSIQSRTDILALIGQYDRDGAYLTEKVMKKDDSFYNFLKIVGYVYDDQRTIDALDTVVHEAFHEYAIPRYSDSKEYENGERIYVGGKKTVDVKFNNVFHTSEMADSVPVRCRSTYYRYSGGDRFKTYIRDESGGMRSNYQGVYGLLNEYAGYCYGLNNTICLYEYRDRFQDTPDTWDSFINNGENDRLAYIEFKYYILHYLRYAKEHHPKDYRTIMKDEQFKKAYSMIDSRFAKEVGQYEKQLTSVRKKLKAAGHTYPSKKLILRKQYSVMEKEIKKTGYVTIQKMLTR